MTKLLWLYPRRWRRRFGAEVEEMLAQSQRPIGDRIDLVVTAPGVLLAHLRSEDNVSKLDAMRIGLAVVLGAGVALTVVAATQLENGVAEVGQHWWSGAPALLIVVSAAGLVVARRGS